ncbi:MAG: hypothetical protein HY769_04290 [Candidatus Stahlbacteria bacterium]|nr:hypothetical protein [Candidatus Stahlbacteria bacterium]
MRQIEKTSVFTKDFKKVSTNIQEEVWKIICILRENAFDRRLNIKKLEGYKNIWRVKVKTRLNWI